MQGRAAPCTHLVAVGRRDKDGESRLDLKLFVLVHLLQDLCGWRWCSEPSRREGGSHGAGAGQTAMATHLARRCLRVALDRFCADVKVDVKDDGLADERHLRKEYRGRRGHVCETREGFRSAAPRGAAQNAALLTTSPYLNLERGWRLAAGAVDNTAV